MNIAISDFQEDKSIQKDFCYLLFLQEMCWETREMNGPQIRSPSPLRLEDHLKSLSLSPTK